ncbi:MAG: hypothetical protein CSA20_02110 [Deltaproteobacteria bacterium]|nr:MAG: hypothetical protein CSA20_02110 [Deltaproteobacteria bacterium]
MQLGRTLTRSKEYITFTALLGDVMKLERENKLPHQLVVLQNGGSEADGQFSRTIRSHLDPKRCLQTVVVSPFIEELYHDEAFWLDTMAGEVIMMSLPGERALFMEQRKKQRFGDALIDAARTVCLGKDQRPVLLVHGDPQCVFNSQVNGHLLSPLEKDFRISWLPFSEYLLFYWQENGADITSRRQQLHTLHTALGSFSPFPPRFQLCNRQRIVNWENWQAAMAATDLPKAYMPPQQPGA